MKMKVQKLFFTQIFVKSGLVYIKPTLPFYIVCQIQFTSTNAYFMRYQR